MDTTALYKISYGLYVLSVKDGQKDNGCMINTACLVTSTPNRITIAVNKQNYTHDLLIHTNKFNLSVLTESASFDTIKNFGFQSGKTADKFANASLYERAENGILYLKNATNAVISASVISSTELDTHTLFLAYVEDCKNLSKENSLTYDYYQKHIKPAPQKTEKKGWRCKVCGYVYEGEELPKDFICPICKHPASDFEKI